MNVKKILLAIMMLIMVFAFVACGNDTETSDDSQDVEVTEDSGEGDVIADFDSIDGLWYIDGDLNKESIRITKDGKFTSYTAKGEPDKTGYIEYEAEEYESDVVYWYMLYEDNGEFYLGFADDESENKTDLYVGNGAEPHYVLMDEQ